MKPRCRVRDVLQGQQSRLLSSIIGAAVFFASVATVSAWTNPSTTPPGANASFNPLSTSIASPQAITSSLGIGITPVATFDVYSGAGPTLFLRDPSGGFKLTTSSGANYLESVGSGMAGAADLNFTDMNNSHTWMIIKSTGKVGIGLTNPSNSLLEVAGTASSTGLQVNGNATTTGTLNVTGNVTAAGYFHSSDARLKDNIQTFHDPILTIERLRGVTFSWKKDGTSSAGVIAQEVEQVLPSAVSTDPATGMKSVEYDQLIAPMIEALKEQQAEIASLKYEIAQLKVRN